MSTATNPFDTRRDGCDFEVVDTRTGRIVAVCLPGRDAAQAEADRLWHAELLAAPVSELASDGTGDEVTPANTTTFGDDPAVEAVFQAGFAAEAVRRQANPEVVISEPFAASSPYRDVPGARYYRVMVVINGGAPQWYILENESQVVALSPHADPAAVAQFRASRGCFALAAHPDSATRWHPTIVDALNLPPVAVAQLVALWDRLFAAEAVGLGLAWAA